MTDQYKSRLFVFIKQNENVKAIKSINDNSAEIVFKDGSSEQVSFDDLIRFNK